MNPIFVRVGGIILFFLGMFLGNGWVGEYFLGWPLACNSGISFGFFNVYGFLFAGAGFVFLLFFLWWGRKKSGWFYAGVGLFFAGAIANGLDRIFFGCVRDYFSFFGWFVFNGADVLIMAGAMMMVISMMREKGASKKA